MRTLYNHCLMTDLPYSVLRPQSFTLFASYWAFFFKRQALQTHSRSLQLHSCLCSGEVNPILSKHLGVQQFYLDASLFFSLRDRGRAVRGSSLTGVRSLITLFSLRSSVPICSSLRGLGVRSSTSVRRDFFSMYFPLKFSITNKIDIASLKVVNIIHLRVTNFGNSQHFIVLITALSTVDLIFLHLQTELFLCIMY